MTEQSPAEAIRSAPFWQVLVRPNSFDPERVKTLRECWELAESCRVALRGWYYPHVDRENRGNGKDWIESWVSSGRHREYWRLYQSGQFVHLFSFEEDSFKAEAERRAREDIGEWPGGFRATGYLDVILSLYKITEIFEFASRLGQRGIVGEVGTVTISMNQIKDRVLIVMDPARGWWGFYRATQPVLENTWRLPIEDLIGKAADLALDATSWFFERFGWFDSPRMVFADEQKKLLERRL